MDQYGDPHTDFTITFIKQAGKTNYYELIFAEQNYNSLDSLYDIKFQSDPVNIDPIILKSGITDFNCVTFLFSDDVINDGEYTIRMKMISGFNAGYSSKIPLISRNVKTSAAVFRTVSKAYFDYRCIWEKHKYFKNDITKVENWTQIIMPGEPQEMFSNVENGLGIFVSYNQDSFIY